MRKAFLLLLLSISSSGIRAQDQKFVTIKAGNRISEVLTTYDIFLYPQYIKGTAYLRDGTKAAALMNYNILFEQLLFIDPKGDTLAIKEGKMIKFIALDKDTFYYDKGFIRLVENSNGMKLAVKELWSVADIRKMGSHNRSVNTYAVTSLRTVTDGFGRTRDLVLAEDMILKKEANYYFGDAYNNFVPASKKNLLSLFPKSEREIAGYLNENKVNFNKKEDLDRLVQYLAKH